VSEPLVSVVIPAFNAARTLAASNESALGQTVRDLEIIVVDDGSTDATADVVRSFAHVGVVLAPQANAGAAAARNAGIRLARGRFVALLDADDLWLPRKLEIQLRYLDERPGCQAVQCGALHVDDRLQLLSVHPCTDTGNALIESLLFQNLPAFLSALVVERERLLAVGLFDTSLEILEEWDMALKMSRFCGMRSVPEPLLKYRWHSGNRHRNVEIHIVPGHKVLERLFADPTLPPEVRRLKRRAYATFYRTLAGAYHQQGRYAPFLKWAARSLRAHPGEILYMAGLPARRWRRARSTRAVTGAGS
jgi:glycosyltransferase involved in cell wall biosynthesis